MADNSGRQLTNWLGGTQTRVPFFVLIPAAVLLLVLVVLFARTPLVRQAITHQPERYTELYFSSINTLPKHVTAGQAAHLSFTLVNRQARTATYAYEVDVVEPTITQRSVPHHVQLAAGQRAQQTVSFTVQQPGHAAVVYIRLLGMRQEVHVGTHS